MTDQIGLFQFMVWLAVGAELRLMMTLGNENNLLNRFLGNGKPKPKNGGKGKPKPAIGDWEYNYNMQEQGT